MSALLGTNRIPNPVSRGQKVTIPAGTPVRSMNPSKGTYFTKRATTITVHSASDGWIDLWNDAKKGSGYVMLPTISTPTPPGLLPDCVNAHAVQAD